MPDFDLRNDNRLLQEPNGPRKPEVDRPGVSERLRGIALPEPEPEIRDEILYQATQGYIAAARSSNTRRAYDSDWRHFREWCASGGYDPLPAAVETIQFYLADHADKLALATLDRRLVGIARAHKEAELDSPTRAAAVRDTLQGIRREAAREGRANQKQAMPVMLDDLKELVAATDPDTLQGKRDRALLLLAFAGALRAGEVGKINVGDLREVTDRWGKPKGYVLTIRRSKTDQDGKGQEIPIPYGKEEITCPVRAIKAYLQAANITSGPAIRYVDRHDHIGKLRGGKIVGISSYSVNLVIRRIARVAGWANLEQLSGHSLRSGLASSAALANVPAFLIQFQGRWKKRDMVDRYSRFVEMFRDTAPGSIGM